MTPTRRTFLGISAGAAAAALADDLFGLPRALTGDTGSAPSAELGRLAAVALERARRLGATYADIRINRYHDQVVALRSSPDRDSGTLNHVPSVNESQSFGFGVRVIAAGTWGFAASNVVTPQEIERVTAVAVAVARANAALQKHPVVLAPVKSYVDRYTTPFKKDPFQVSIPDKLALLQDANTQARAVPKVFSATSSIVTHTEDRFFASTEGSRIQQYIVQNYAQLSAQAVDRTAGLARTRNYSPSPVTAGFEAIEEVDLKGNARRVGEEVVEHLSAPPVAPGVKDLVLMPNHLALTIHESVGHATELDRVLGYEANYAGTSFLKPGDLGRLKYGSEWMNIVGDRTLERGMSTCAYDDDGVKTTSFDIVRQGILVGFQTIRDQAHLIGEKESKGCAYADSFDSVPFQRIPNVWLKPGEKEMTMDDLASGVDDGVLIDGRGSWSIDHQRYNFQFGGDAFWEIKGGKRGRMISRVAYQSRTPDFWASLDGVADKRFWVNHGLTSDGKGQPGQVNAMSHGCAPSRFRRVNVLLTD